MSIKESANYESLGIQQFISLTWKVKNFTSRRSNTSRGFRSANFGWCDATWHLKVYPKEYAGFNGKEFIHVRIVKSSPSVKSPPAVVTYMVGFKDINCKVQYTVKCQVLYTCYTRYFTATSLIPAEELLGSKPSQLLLDGSLVIFCEMKMDYGIPTGQNCRKFAVATSTYAKGVDVLSVDLETLLKEQKNCDITLQTGDASFHAHKIILAARSDVFAAMFGQDTEDTLKVTIEDVSAEVLRDMLHYIYTGDVLDFSVDKAFKLYPAADRYALRDLKNQCAEMMSNHLCPDTVCEFAMLADAQSDDKVRDEMRMLACKKASVILLLKK